MNTPDKTPIDVPRHIVRNNKVPAKLGGQVLYVLSPNDAPTSHGRVRPATIVHLVDDGSVHGLVNIVFFTDVTDNLPPVQHVRNVIHDEERYERRAGDEIFLEYRPGTWHWPPPRELVFEHIPVQMIPAEDPQHDDHDELDADTIELASLKDPFPVAEPPAGFEKDRETASDLPFSGLQAVTLFRRIWRWFFPAPFFRMLNEARERGRVSLQEVDIGKNQVGWYASIRPAQVGKGGHAHRYAWTGQDEDIGNALEQAVEEAREFPIMIAMTESRCAPKLGGKEFDDE